jgi:uncharacterized phage protein (TIGR01671 family)
MNDRFKFRVWDKKYNEYIPSSMISTLLYFGHRDEFHIEFKCFSTFADSLIIEQCTDMKDKNGNLIYEGDKVEISVYGDVINEGFVETDTQYQGIVVWAKQGFYVEVADEFFYIPEEPEDVEIIGNIHEQPEQKDVK